MFQEELLDFLPRRKEVLPLKRGSDIIRNVKGCFFIKDFLNLFTGILISCENYGKLECHTKPRLWIGGRNIFCQFYNMCYGAAIGAAGKEYHIGSKVSDAINLFVWKALVIGCNNIHYDCACSECCALSAFGGHCLDCTCDHHLQSAACAACGNVNIYANITLRGRNNLFAV